MFDGIYARDAEVRLYDRLFQVEDPAAEEDFKQAINPDSLTVIENAKVDGATDFQIFVKIILPLSFPVLASFAIFQFLWVWNDYLVALVFLGIEPESRVLTVELADLAGRGEGALNLLPAAAFVTMILPLAVFFGLQRFFVRGLTAGSVKG